MASNGHWIIQAPHPTHRPARYIDTVLPLLSTAKQFRGQTSMQKAEPLHFSVSMTTLKDFSSKRPLLRRGVLPAKSMLNTKTMTEDAIPQKIINSRD